MLGSQCEPEAGGAEGEEARMRGQLTMDTGLEWTGWAPDRGTVLKLVLAGNHREGGSAGTAGRTPGIPDALGRGEGLGVIRLT